MMCYLILSDFIHIAYLADLIQRKIQGIPINR